MYRRWACREQIHISRVVHALPRAGVRTSAGRRSYLFSYRNRVAEVNNDSESKVAPADVSILTRSPMINVLAGGNSVQQQKEKCERLPEDI